MLPTTWLQRLTPSEVSIRGITWLTGRNESAPLDEVLAARVRKKPLVLLLDEAHTLDGEVGSTLLNTSQQIERDLPFLLVLAGTPSLRFHLDTMNVSFWNRAERRPVGRLDPAAAGEAIRQPLHGENIDIDEDALVHVVRETHGYPYFVQLWGDALWRQATEAAEPEARRRLTRAAADAVQSAFDREKNDYYLDRYEELEKLDLLPVARTVAEAFGAQPLLDDSQLETGDSQGTGNVGRRGRDDANEGRAERSRLRLAARGNPDVGTRHPKPDGLCACIHPRHAEPIDLVPSVISVIGTPSTRNRNSIHF